MMKFTPGLSLSRRTAVGGIAAAGALILTGRAGAQAGAEPVVETRLGKLRGLRHETGYSFKGVRYAVADRFMPPRKPKPWSGVQDALEFGASAPSSNPNPPAGGGGFSGGVQFPRASAAAPGPRPPESEDCQYLNVWTSALNDGRKRPVMVSLHGGFFFGGSGAGVDGSRLAARGDVVVVSVNHRLNAFGYTHLADHLGDEFAHSGNAGMLDIIAALEWVRDNIDRFGGDPQRVMVFGTSGGGMKTSFLMASPRAKGLLHRAGIQSGPGLKFMERADAAAVTDRLLSRLNLDRGRAADLVRVPTRDLLAAYHAVSAELPAARFIDLPCFAPVIDPELLPHHPFSPHAAELTRSIPLITGWTGQEMTFFMGADPEGFELDEAGLEERARGYLGEQSSAILAQYRQAMPDASPSRLYIQSFSDCSVMLPAVALADRKAAGGTAPVYAYRLDYQSPALDGKIGAPHNMELPLIFDTVDYSRPLFGPSEEPVRLARQMSSAWVQFAATGDPNGAGTDLPEWPRYTVDDREVMLLDTVPQVAKDPVRMERTALAPLLKV